LLLSGAFGTAATGASAGAWLREEGAGLIYFSQEEVEDQETNASWGYTTLYAEYGIAPRLTFGIDAGKGEDDDDWKALMFLRTGWELGWLPGRIALEMGVGASGAPDGTADSMFRPSVSWGNSFETPLGWAWVNVDAAAEYRLGWSAVEAETRPGYDALSFSEGYKLDLTLGLNATPRTQILAEFRSEYPSEGDRTLRLVPSVARRFGDGVWLQLGAIVGLDNDDTVGVIFGSRIEF